MAATSGSGGVERGPAARSSTQPASAARRVSVALRSVSSPSPPLSRCGGRTSLSTVGSSAGSTLAPPPLASSAAASSASSSSPPPAASAAAGGGFEVLEI